MPENPDLLTLLSVSLAAILPTFVWILAGLLIRQGLPFTEPLFRRGDRLTFYVGMPLVLFFSASKLDFHHLSGSTYLIAGTIAILLMVVGSYCYAGWRGFSRGHRGLVAQAAYRANLSIIGLSLCSTAFGERGLVAAAMPIAAWTFLFNLIAVVLLNYTHGKSSSPPAVIRSICTNPLILSILAGVMLALSGWQWPPVMARAPEMVAKIVIPFALMCLGAAISLRSMREAGAELMESTVLRLCVSPLLAVAICLLMGTSGLELGVTFLLLGGPAAMACHVMVASVGGNARLAANSVVITTLLAPISLTAGLFLLRALGLI